MAGLGDALISVGADVSSFEDDLAGALESALDSNKFAKLGVTAAVAFSTAAVAAFVPLEKQILEIFQVGGVNVTDELFNTLSGNVLDIAAKVGKPAEEVGSAIALGLGRGFSLEASEEISKVSGELSVALGQDLNGAAQAITATMNGFGLSMEDTTKVAGTLYQTAAKAGIPISQLAQQIGNLAPAAKTAGLGLNDVAAAVTTMVQGGASAAESTTQIRTAITELSRAGSDGGKVFQKISGTTFPNFIKQGHTLQDGLQLIRAAADKSGYSVQELTGNYNTANAVIATTGANTKRYTQNLIDNKKGTEDLADAVDTAEQGSLRKFQRAFNDIRTSVQELAVQFRPVISAVTTGITGAMGQAAGVISDLATRISTMDFTAVTDAIAKFGALFKAVFDTLASLDWKTIGSTVAQALAPLGGLLMGAAQAAGALATFITAVLGPAVQWLSQHLDPLVPVLAAIVAGLLAWKIGMMITGIITALGAGVTGLRTKLMALNATIRANPFVFWASIAAAVVVGLVVMYQKFEWFRKGVADVLTAIVTGFTTGVDWIVKLILLIPRTWLNAAKMILDSLAHLPKWLGGGVADSAASAVQALLNGIDAIEAGVNSITGAAREATRALDGMVESAAKAGAFAGGGGPIGPKSLFPDKAAEDAAEANQKLLDAFAKNTPDYAGPKPNIAGLGDLVDPKKDKKAAAGIKDRLGKLVIDIYRHIVKLAKNAATMSVSAIGTATESIINKFRKAIEHAAELGRTGAVKILKDGLKAFKGFAAQLTKLAKKRDAITEKLNTAKQALKELRDESDAFEASMKAAFVNIGSVAEASQGIGVTFRGIRNNLRDAIRTTTLFNDAIKQLQSLGLNEDSLRQLAEAGPAALDQARALARSGAGGIKEINDLQAVLDDGAAKVADRLADDFYNAGIAAAEGVVKGLQSQRGAIIKEMQAMGDAMVKEARKILKIHSPSEVFEKEIGMQLPAGAAVGVRKGIPDLIKAVQEMSAATTNAGSNFGAGAVQINGVSDPAAARRAGILAGEAIAQTLQKRATAQTLAGVR